MSKSSSLRDEDDETDYSNDDNYQNDEDDSNDEEYTGPPPEITTKGMNLTVMEDGDVFLPCDINNRGKFVVMWKNSSLTLWVDGRRMNANSRVEEFKNNTLVIRRVNMHDSGQYTCQVVADKIIQVTHTLNVVRKLSITRILPEVRPGQSKILRKGESLTLACEATGYPVPKVFWVRRGRKHFPNGHERMEGTSITFEEVNRKYSGIYECEASNDFGTVRKAVEIHVHYPPEIEIEEETVTTAVGLQPEITCTVHAEPKANVTWYKNGDIVTKKSQISTTVVNNKYTLQITKMNEDDFGSYTCHAKNELGSKQKAIVLSGAPTKPKFKVGFTKDDKTPEILWTVESYLPIIEYEFQYKKLQDDKWTKITPMQTVAIEGNMYTGKEILTGLPPNDYQVRVRAKNSHGWSFYSEEKIFNGDMAAESTNGGVKLGIKGILVQIIVFSYVFIM
ncbi:protein CEPU-1 precursor, putative [Pediculus humanus corporis]|uniref:Protein CEPU-1, putative n=1 Tax=Pediculus humanus subsp. corporis TaxID=121224 RepID=E0VJT9_PEDHC|nr:protein CEPU-1 precursor, putative [Pediculus humanus corporis]EEB13645.1 protein CEPU-1 precursor, putative [Pediculus humanus corporis]